MWARWLVVVAGAWALSSKKKAPGPRRITSGSVRTSGLSLRQQLGLVRAVKESAKPAVARAKAPLKKAPKRNETRAAAGDAFYVGRPLVLVDGYNVVFYQRKVDGDDGRELDGRREDLINKLCAVAALRSWDVVVAFDAGAVASPALREAVAPHCDVVYTGEAKTADAYIEQACYDRRLLGHGATLVATNDAMVRLMASAHGAQTMSSDQITRECEAAKQTITHRLEARQAVSDAARATDAHADFHEALFESITGTSVTQAKQAQDRKHRALKHLLATVGRALRTTVPKETTEADDRARALLLELRDVEAGLPETFRRQDFRLLKHTAGLLDLLDEDWAQKHPLLSTATAPAPPPGPGGKAPPPPPPPPPSSSKKKRTKSVSLEDALAGIEPHEPAPPERKKRRKVIAPTAGPSAEAPPPRR